MFQIESSLSPLRANTDQSQVLTSVQWRDQQDSTARPRYLLSAEHAELVKTFVA